MSAPQAGRPLPVAQTVINALAPLVLSCNIMTAEIARSPEDVAAAAAVLARVRLLTMLDGLRADAFWNVPDAGSTA